MRNGGVVRCPECKVFVEVPGESRISTPLFVATCAHCGLEFDWRLSHHDFLRGATLVWQEYFAEGEGVWSYDRCSLCWQTFGEVQSPGVVQAGYVTFPWGDPWWVCRCCFDDFHEEMDWLLEPPAD